ncbi:MAG: dihydrolipoyl dehydrogenase [Gemmatimonadetes bacterium]|nr:dihydrolipoyl dehydrogenase [Gemmatimonadota bacterium]MDA1102156.1 dihydrolipoyl dehydrogenase [Gemmatimonadota bacterium]
MAGTDSFDLIIIGSGPGGYVAAIRASQLGLNVACVEDDKLGGVCLNIGCIPTKALLTSAFLANEMKEGAQHGIIAKDLTFDLGPAQQRSRKVADQLNKGVTGLFKKNKVTHLPGRGRLKGAGKVEVEAADGTRAVYNSKHIIIGTGSRPRDLPVLKIDEDRIWSSTGALMQEKAPATLFIVGAGAIGMEFADVFDSFGTKVTIVEALDRILPLEDAEISKFMERVYKKRGVDVHTGARFQAAEIGADGVRVSFTDKKGDTQTMDVDYVLSAVGRVPNSQDLGLDTVGVATDSRGFIVVDEYLRTNVPGVYAIGDVAGNQLLAHKATHEGIVCVEHIVGQGHGTVDYGNVPNCTYCHPEVASVGLTEEQAKEQGYDIEVGKFPWVGIGRAVAAGHTDGFVKIIRDKQYSEILGAHIVGSHATELIAEFVIGRHLESTVEELEKAMHPHPTLSEGVAEGALAALGRAIHT